MVQLASPLDSQVHRRLSSVVFFFFFTLHIMLEFLTSRIHDAYL